MHEVPCVPPVSIGKDGPDLRESRSNGFSAYVPRSAGVGPGRGFKDAILRHERHESIDVVAVPRVGKVLQYLRGDFRNRRLHDHAAPPTGCTVKSVYWRPPLMWAPSCCIRPRSICRRPTRWLPARVDRSNDHEDIAAEAQGAGRIRASAAPSSAAGAGGGEAPELALSEPLDSRASLRAHPRRRAAQGSLSEARAAAVKRSRPAPCASARADASSQTSNNQTASRAAASPSMRTTHSPPPAQSVAPPLRRRRPGAARWRRCGSRPAATAPA